MYFDESPMAKERLSEEFVPVSKPRISLPPAPSFIEPEIMRQSLKLYQTNKLFQFLSFHFGQEATEELMLRYHVGTSKHWPGATVFWQVDISGRVRTGKVMLYNSENGRRIKEPHNYITWVHSLLKKDNFNLRQCLFGEHLLSSDQQRPVALWRVKKRFDIQLLSAAISMDCFGRKERSVQSRCHERIEKPTCSTFSRSGCYRLLEQ